MDIEPSLLAYTLLEREETALASLDGQKRQWHFGRIVRMCAEATLEEGQSQAVTQLHKLAQRIIGFKTTEFKKAVEVEIAKIREHSNNGDGLPQFVDRVPDDHSGDRPKICLGKVESEFAAAVGATLGPLGVLFRLNDQVVEIQKEEFNGELDRFKLARGGYKFNVLTPARMRTWIEQYIDVWVVGQFGPAPKTISEASARSLLVSPQFLEHIPRIDRILDVPILIRKADGTIVSPQPGFDASLSIYCVPDAPEIVPMTLKEAKEILGQALAGFCWKKYDDKKPEKSDPANLNNIPQSKIHAIAALLTPYARGLMGFSERFPFWLYSGNRPRCGKDYLNGVRQIVYLGHTFEDAPITDNHEETGKRIISANRAGRRMMHFANCQHHLNDPYLIQAITDQTLHGRALGSNDAKSDLSLSNEIDYSISANVGLTYREDVEPRLRKIELEFFEEDANKRTFPNPYLHDWAKENRGRILSAIHAFFQYWISQGAPVGKTLFNSYPRWAEVVGGVMVTCGLGDPCLPHEGEDLLGGDLREVAMKTLFRVGFKKFPNQWIQKKDVYDLVRDSDDDRLNWFGTLDGDDDEKRLAATKRIGKALASFRNRLLGGIKLEMDVSAANSGRWKYKFSFPSSPEESDRDPDWDVPGPPESPAPDEGALPPFEEVQSAAEANFATPLGVPAIAVDLETYGKGMFSKRGKFRKDPDALSPWRGQIRLVTWADSAGIIRQHDLQQGPLSASTLETLTRSTWVAHNAKFEILFLARLTGITPKEVFDTMTASRLLTNGDTGKENSLGAVLARQLDVRLPKDQGKSYWGALVLSPEQIKYAHDDVRYLLPLAEKLKTALAAAGLTEVFELESKLIPVVVRMELHGVAIDRALLSTRLEPMATNVALHETRATKLLGEDAPLLGDSPGIKERLQSLGATVDGEPIPNAEEDTLVRCQHPAAQAIVAYRKAKQPMDRAEAWLEASARDGKIHASFNPLGPKTGRFSCADPNLQNVPREKDLFRDCVIPSDPDRVLVVADYSNIELRIGAIDAEEEIMLQAFREGRDIHRPTAAAVLGKAESAVTGDERQLAKVINFGFLYGQGAKGLLDYARAQWGLEFTLEEATGFRAKFFEQYPSLKQWHSNARKDSDFATESRTVSGRRQLLTAKDSDWNRFQALTNTVVQGSGADLLKLAMVRVAAALPPEAHLILCCHDELITDSPKALAQEVKVIMERCMNEAFRHYFGDVIPADVVKIQVCTNWQEK